MTAPDARAALAALTGMIVTLLLIPADMRLMIPAFVLTGSAAAAGSLPSILRRVRLLLPMLLALGLIILLRSDGENVLWTVGGVSLSREAFVVAGLLLTRLLLIATASLLFIAVIPLSHIVAAMRWMHIPRTVISVAWLTERFLTLLSLDGRRMLESVRARSAALPLHSRVLVAARLSGTFLVRAVGRSERLADALSARGYIGTVPTLQHLRWTQSDSLFILIVTCLLILLWLV